ncbi:MAG: MotA/TolQ/ExbB proton channel family protein [Gemmataceae bacterium]
MKALIAFYTEDWYFAAPMTIMAIVGFFLIAWRMMLNFSAKTRMDDFLPDLQETLRKHGTRGAIELCKQEKGLMPQILFVAGLEAADQGVAAMRRSMASAVELEILPRLNFLLAPIIAIAKIATMVGLLGTVISMIGTFSKIGEASGKGGAGSVTSSAGAIGLALFATALGLVTAIPLVFMHVLFKEWIHNFETRMKAAATKLIVLVQNVKNGVPAEEPIAAEPVRAAKPNRT